MTREQLNRGFHRSALAIGALVYLYAFLNVPGGSFNSESEVLVGILSGPVAYGFVRSMGWAVAGFMKDPPD